ncbi:uncharacterized protein LOC126679193 [Mercurialis annua]|uniref:uncharacterized protein LOC126679193 n=1 Tax=Mercurialis annua TaxID=3986 RepID=UPI00215FB37A|nr:uncharacterized protein LOC126679193 [Mercurialis annua]
MGRARGKGKKHSVSVIASHEDHVSVKEENTAVDKKRGRSTMDDNGEETAEIMEDGMDAKESVACKDVKSPSTAENGLKRKRAVHAKESTASVKEENGVGNKLSGGNSTMSTGFRHIGSRRKNKPRRAAEAVVECW